MKKILLLIATVFVARQAEAQISCAAARATAVGTVVTVKGIVSNGNEFGTATRYIQDGTGGIACYNVSLSTYNRGDSVTITGTLANFNGLLEVQSPSFAASLVSSGNAVHTPLVTNALSGYIEAHEGMLLQLNNVTFSATGTFSGNSNYTITSNGTQEDIRISTGSNLVGTPIPVGPVNVVGILGEYNVGSYTGTSYQLLLRDVNDIMFAGNPPVITSALVQKNITTTSFDVLFNTQNQGNTLIRYGLTAGSMTSTVTNATLQTAHVASLTGLIPATIYYVQGLSISATNDTSFSAVTAMATASNSSGKMTVYFNRPVNNSVAKNGHNAIQLAAAMDDTLIAYINRAVSTLDIAIYNVDNNLGVITAVNNATQRGVNVRLVCDQSVGSGTFNTFTTANKHMAPVGSATYGIMHNKFLVMDVNDPNSATVCTGSMNWTDQQILSDANNVIIIQDQSLARAYTAEFNEMYNGNVFGASKSNNTPHEFNIKGKRVELYFSPTDGTNSQIKNHLTTANYDVYTAVMSFTRTELGYAIIDSAVTKNGAYYAGIVDDTSGTGAAAPFNNFYSHGITTELIDKGSYIFHHKYAIIDPNDACSDPMVCTGSHNWSSSADTKNDENELIIHDSTIANLYYQEFYQRYLDLNGSLLMKTYKACAGSIGINELTAANAFSIYPNPANETITVQASNPIQGQVQLNVSDRIGRTYFQQQLNGLNKTAIDLSKAPAGLYFITINAANQTTTYRFVKM